MYSFVSNVAKKAGILKNLNRINSNNKSKYCQISPLIKDRASLKTQIISGIQINGNDYRYDKRSEFLQQFDDSPLVDCQSIQDITVSSSNWSWISNLATKNQEFIDSFAKLITHCNDNGISIESTEFDIFIDDFTLRLSQFNENELLVALQLFVRMPFNNLRYDSRNFRELLMAFDDNSGRLSADWNIDKRLAACSIWCTIPHNKKSKFSKMVCNRFKRDISQLSPKHFVMAVFFMNYMHRYMDDNVDFEKDFLRVIDDLSIGDVANVCYTFNRDDYRLHNNELIDKIVEKALACNLDEISDLTLRQILKIIKTSCRIYHFDQLNQLMNNLKTQLNKRSLSVCIRFLLVAESVFVHNPDIFENILERTPDAINQLLPVDLLDICCSLVKFDYQSPKNLHKTVPELILKNIRERVTQLGIIPVNFHMILYCLAILGYHDHEIIHNALREDFIHIAYKHLQFLGSEVCGLNAFVQINLKNEYKGNLLEEKHKKIMREVITATSTIKTRSKVFGAHRMCRNLMEILDELEMPYQLGYALPHFRIPDVYVVFDKESKNVIQYSKEFPELHVGRFILKDDFTENNSNLEVIALIGSYWSDYCRLKGTPNHFLKLKLKQLELLGYRPCFIDFNHWYPQSQDERKITVNNYLKEIFEQIS